MLFFVSSPTLSNNLPQDVRSCANQVTFKSWLKSHLFSLAFTVYSLHASAPRFFLRSLALYKFYLYFVFILQLRRSRCKCSPYQHCHRKQWMNRQMMVSVSAFKRYCIIVLGMKKKYVKFLTHLYKICKWNLKTKLKLCPESHLPSSWLGFKLWLFFLGAADGGGGFLRLSLALTSLADGPLRFLKTFRERWSGIFYRSDKWC